MASRNKYYNGPVSDHFDGRIFHLPGYSATKSVGDLLRWRFNGKRATWPKAYPSPFTGHQPVRADRMRVTLIGHASFLLQLSGLNILVDPVFSERCSPVSFAGPARVNPPGIAFDQLPPIDVVLVSHNHYDHLDLASLAKLHHHFQPRFVCPLGNDAIIHRASGGMQVSAHDWGAQVDLGKDVKVHFVPSYHWSARGLGDRCMALWCAFVLTSPEGAIYHIADTGYVDGRIFREVARQFPAIDLAVVPIGAYEPRWFMHDQHVNPADAVRLMSDCGARSAIGHHWGTFQLTDEPIDHPPQQLRAALAAEGVAEYRFQAFRPGQAWRKSAA